MHSNPPSPTPTSPGSVARPSRNLPLTRVRMAAGETPPPCMFGVISFNGDSSFVLPSVMNNFVGCAPPRMTTSSQQLRFIAFEWKVFISTIHNLNLATAQNSEYRQPISTTVRGQVVPMGPHLSTGQTVPTGGDWTSSSHGATPFECASSFVGPHLSTEQLVPMGGTPFNWTSSSLRRTRFD